MHLADTIFLNEAQCNKLMDMKNIKLQLIIDLPHYRIQSTSEDKHYKLCYAFDMGQFRFPRYVEIVLTKEEEDNIIQNK